MVRDGDRLRDPDDPRWWRTWHDLDWFCRANQGLDWALHPIQAWIEDDRLVVQHGENPEAVRHFTLDELNQVGDFWGPDPVQAWCDLIDRYEGGPDAGRA